jgi:hypothetical protein
VAIHIDAKAYPILRWGVERAVCQGVPVRSFPHDDAERPERAARAVGRRGVRLERGMRTALRRPRPTAGPRLIFLITARHHFIDIDAAVDAFAAATAWRAGRLGGTK